MKALLDGHGVAHVHGCYKIGIVEIVFNDFFCLSSE